MSDNHPYRDSELAVVDPANLEVSESTAARIAAGIPANTRRSYDGVWRRFEQWCGTAGRDPLPATAQTLAAYVDHLCDAGRAPSTIEHAIAVVRKRHKLAGHAGQPDTEAARLALRGYRKEWADRGNRARKASPAVVEVVRKMVATCDTDTLKGLRDRAIIVLGFAAMARRSELAALDIRDLSFTDKGLLLYFRYSKTDQDAQGVEVPLPYGSNTDTCPVRAAQAWLNALAARGLVDGPLFVGVDRHGRLGAARAGRTAGRLHPDSINRIVKKAAKGVTTAHGLRAGGATTSYRAGKGVAAIADHGRWKQGSPVLLGYIRAVDQWEDNAMSGVGL